MEATSWMWLGLVGLLVARAGRHTQRRVCLGEEEEVLGREASGKEQGLRFWVMLVHVPLLEVAL